jgi:hypothetical protein
VVAQRILDDLDALVERLGTLYREHVPEYAALSDAAMETEVLPVTRKATQAFFEAVVTNREPRVEDVIEFDTMGRRRLDMGVPLEPMLHVYRMFGRGVWEAVVAATPEGEERVLADLGARWMDYVDRASSIAASGYLEASHERLRHVDARRSAVLDALLAVRDSAEIAALSTEFAINFADAYMPVLVAASDVATRIDAVSRVCPAGALVGHRGTHLLLLVPGSAPDLALVLAEAGGGIVAYGRAATPGPDLAAELAHTEQLAAVAASRGVTGVIGPGDLLIEQLLAANARVASDLRRRLGPFLDADRGGALASTLRTYLALGSVPDTAAAESVHPNTVAYRLRRVAELTGLDPRVPEQAALLSLAVHTI